MKLSYLLKNTEFAASRKLEEMLNILRIYIYIYILINDRLFTCIRATG